MGRSPTISTSSPTLTRPRSTLPVTTVPRPEMVNTSSIGIRNGLSVSRSGSGMKSSTACHELEDLLLPLRVALEGLERRDPDHRGVVAGELVLAEQLPDLELDQVEQLLVVDHVGLVEGHHDRRHADLAGQQHVLTGLGHGAVGGGYHQDGPVDLGRTGDHVLDVVGVARHVDVGVVPVGGLVLDVGDVDRDAPLPLLGGLVDLVERLELGAARVALGEDLGDRRGQGGLAVVDVAHRPDVEVGLVALELLLGHGRACSSCGPATWPGYRRGRKR